MMVLITYDVALNSESGSRRLRNIAKICQDYGTRVQYSVFECEVDPAQWVQLKAKLFRAYDEEVDSLRFYMLGKHWRSKVEHHGAKPALDLFADSIII